MFNIKEIIQTAKDSLKPIIERVAGIEKKVDDIDKKVSAIYDELITKKK